MAPPPAPVLPDAATRRPADLVVEAGWLLTMVDDAVIDAGAVAVVDGRIAAVGTTAEIDRDYVARRRVGSPECIVLPGFVNAHTHVGDQLYGTLCDEEDLTDTLYEVIFPLAGALDAELLHRSARLGLWDAARSGVTTVCDQNMFADSTARAAVEIGVRAVVAEKVVEYAMSSTPRYDRDARRYVTAFDRGEAERLLAAGVDFAERWRGHDLVRPAIGPLSADHLSAEMYVECARAAEALDVRLLTHVAATEAELGELARRGRRGAIRYLQDIGVLSERMVAAHMVFVDDEEIAIAADAGIAMTFNPTSNIAGRSFPPIARIRASGMRTGFGTDEFSMDVLRDLRTSIHLANHLCAPGDPPLRAADVLRMATIEGAHAIGLGAEIGSLEVGKRADLAVVDLRDGHLAAATSPTEALAYLATSRDVTHTIVGGVVVMEHGRLTQASQETVFAEGRAATRRWLADNAALLGRGGLTARIHPSMRS